MRSTPTSRATWATLSGAACEKLALSRKRLNAARFFPNKPPVNGRQLTADDMAASYERPLGIGRFAGQEPSPVGIGTALIPMESITATDELTIEIKLSQPRPDTHQLLLNDLHIYARPPETFDTLDDANNVIGTGPFIMDEFVSGTSVTFDRNPNYWKDDERFPGNRLPYVDRLVMLVMGDEATRIAALRSGQADISGFGGMAAIKSISGALDVQKTNPGMQLFAFSTRSEVSSPMKNHDTIANFRKRFLGELEVQAGTGDGGGAGHGAAEPGWGSRTERQGPSELHG